MFEIYLLRLSCFLAAAAAAVCYFRVVGMFTGSSSIVVLRISKGCLRDIGPKIFFFFCVAAVDFFAGL